MIIFYSSFLYSILYSILSIFFNLFIFSLINIIFLLLSPACYFYFIFISSKFDLGLCSKFLANTKYGENINLEIIFSLRNRDILKILKFISFPYIYYKRLIF